MKEWEKILKSDEDYDYYFILRILQYKLSRTRRCILENNIIADSKKVGREIREVEKLLEKVLKDKYDDDALKPLIAKYGPRRLRFKSIPIPGKNLSECKVSSAWDKLPTAQKNRAHRELRSAWQKANTRRLNDLRKAFDLIHKNIWGWWD